MMLLLLLDVIDNHVFITITITKTGIFMGPAFEIREMMVRFDMCETQCGKMT